MTDVPDDGPVDPDAGPTPASVEEAKRAIEAVVMVADEPVDPQLLGELTEISPARVEEICAELAAEYDSEGRGFVGSFVKGLAELIALLHFDLDDLRPGERGAQLLRRCEAVAGIPIDDDRQSVSFF